MKTIEEKAKAYDEAIKKAESLYKASEPMSGCNVIIETLFPELAESEDEKIRKRLITDFGTIGKKEWGGLEVKDILAWLENIPYTIDHEKREGFHLGYKAGLERLEMKTAEESLGVDSDTNNKIVVECIFGEQKPNDKVEPRFKVKYAGSEYNVLEVKDIAGVTFYGIEDEPNHIDYVKAEKLHRGAWE